MTRYVLKRLVLLPALLFLFSVTVSAVVQAAPGDFLTTYGATLASSGSSISAEQIEALRREYGLDRPIWVQYLRWMQNLLTGNLGLSLEYQRPNAELIGERLVLTVVLALFAFAITWIVAIPAGIYSAMHPRSALDYLLTVLNYIGVATPNFMLALVLMWGAFAYFGLSVTGLFSPDYVEAPWSAARVVDLLKHVWLPAVVLGVAGTARLTRVMRANLLDELNKPYVTTARAKGLPEWRLVLRYPARLALNPLVSTIGWYLPALFSGSLIVATVMNLPNIGPLLLRALINQDMYLAGSILLIYCFLTILGTLISDILLAWLDPRIRLDEGCDDGASARSGTGDGRGSHIGRVELATGVVAVPKAPPGAPERARVARPLRRRAVPRFRQHPGSRGDGRSPGLHSGAAPPPLRRRAPEPLGPRGRRQAQSHHAPHGVGRRREPEDPGPVLRDGVFVSPARDRPGPPPLARHGRAGRPRAPLSAGHRSTGPRPVVTPRARHPHLHDDRPHRGDVLRRAGRDARRDLRLLRRDRGCRDPAADRAFAVPAHDPDLARAHGGAAAGLVAPAGVLRHHGDLVPGGLGDSRAGSPRG